MQIKNNTDLIAASAVEEQGSASSNVSRLTAQEGSSYKQANLEAWFDDVELEFIVSDDMQTVGTVDRQCSRTARAKDVITQVELLLRTSSELSQGQPCDVDSQNTKTSERKLRNMNGKA